MWIYFFLMFTNLMPPEEFESKHVFNLQVCFLYIFQGCLLYLFLRSPDTFLNSSVANKFVKLNHLSLTFFMPDVHTMAILAVRNFPVLDFVKLIMCFQHNLCVHDIQRHNHLIANFCILHPMWKAFP